jgi:hypothetical protein
MKTTFVFALLMIGFNSFAEVVSFKISDKISFNENIIGIGSSVKMTATDKSLNGDFIFLGNGINPSGEETFRILLNKNSKSISLVNSDEFKRNNSLQKILDLYEQKGGTCTGYAIFDYLQQIVLNNFVGNGELPKLISTEEGRSQLLADSINRYYLETQHRNSIKGIMNAYGKDFGFKCTNYQTNDISKAKTRLLSQLSLGNPVIISFNIGPQMVTAPFPIIKHGEKNGEVDNRLWIPRKIGERNSGGHSIVAAANFKFNGKDYLVMLDSDWTEPRVWDVDSYLANKTAIEEVEFISCK